MVPGRNGALRLVEVKATATPRPEMTQPMQRLAAASAKSKTMRGRTTMTLVHLPIASATRSTAIAPGVEAVPWPDFVDGGF